jgi:hypothetical protein
MFLAGNIHQLSIRRTLLQCMFVSWLAGQPTSHIVSTWWWQSCAVFTTSAGAMPPPIRPMTRANRRNSHVPLSTRRSRWRDRRRLIAALFVMGLLPGNGAAHLLASFLIPNPHARAGDVVNRHTPMHPTARAYENALPGHFADSFALPKFDDVVTLAAHLGLQRIKCPSGHVASPGEALLVVLLRLRCKAKWTQLGSHYVFNTTPGHKWSDTKMKRVFKQTMIELHRLHGHRITWSPWCFSAPSCARYANALCTKLGLNMHQNIMGIIDGTHRAQARPVSRGGMDRQREFYNGWLHKHCLGFQAVITPDGLFASLAGPFPGSRNDGQKLTMSRLLPVFQNQCPGYRVLGDAGYPHNPAGIIVRGLPGGPFPAGTPNARYNKAIAETREAVEWPFGHVTKTFPMLDDRHYMKTNTPVRVIYKTACLLHNCLLCMGHGNREVSSYFNCPPPSLANYLA